MGRIEAQRFPDPDLVVAIDHDFRAAAGEGAGGPESRGQTDDDDPSLDVSTTTNWCHDTDGDGYGDDNACLDRCEAPPLAATAACQPPLGAARLK